MITKVRIKNFQKHKELEVKFDPHVTTIVGRTDVGKSSVLRALGFIGHNRWDPSFLRHGKETCEIILEVDGKKLRRVKGKGQNKFYLGNKEFKAFSSSTPEEIEEILKLGPENFQRQLDPHFWFHDTPGTVSKNLNQIVNLGTIDSSLSNVATELRRKRSEVDLTETRLKKAESQVESLAWVKDCQADLEAVEGLKVMAEKKSNSLASVASSLKTVAKLRLDIDNTTEARLDGEKLILLGESVQKRRRETQKLDELLKEASKVRALMDEKIPDIQELRAIRIEGVEIAERGRAVEFLVTELDKLEEELCVVNGDLKKAEERFLKVTKGRCPTCGGLLKIHQTKMSSQSSCQTSISDTKPRSAGKKKGKSGIK